MAQVFFLSGQRKIEGLVYRLDLQVLDLSVTVPTGVKESTYLMFDKMANLPLPSWFAAPVVSYAEFILPICLVLGLATRFAAYRNQTAPILPYYRDRGILHTVDGMADIDEVARQIEAVLGNSGSSR